MDGLTEFPLPDQGGDRGFVTESGLRFRVRLRRTDSDFAKPAPGIDPALTAPTKMTLSLSISLLDVDNNVETVAGKYRIFDRHEILVSDDNLANPGFDIQGVVEAAIIANIAAAEAIIANQTVAIDYLTAAWGIDTLTDVPPPAASRSAAVKPAQDSAA